MEGLSDHQEQNWSLAFFTETGYKKGANGLGTRQ